MLVPERTPSEGQKFDDSIEQDRRLVQRMLSGDEHAMEEFADRFFPRLYRFATARLRGNTDLARDIVQTTVCKALTKLESFRGEAPLFAWLCSCCRNELLMHFRRQKAGPTVMELTEGSAAYAQAPVSTAFEAPGERLDRKEAARRVHESLDQLPPHYAQALEWKYLDHLPVAEIAHRLSLGPKATESVLTRARVAFRRSYERLAHYAESFDLAATGTREMQR
jgi:RNA polymerase sigma-70 factor (ECF subfamily)